MGSLSSLVRDLKNFEAKKPVIKEFRQNVRKPLPGIRKAVKAQAMAILPKSGGLNAWVAKSTVSLVLKMRSATSAQIKLKAARKSQKNKSDLNRIDKGRVRAPSWGKRTAASWHTQSVSPGFFTEPAKDSKDEFIKVAQDAIDTATERIRNG
jgi:hypothetical protein